MTKRHLIALLALAACDPVVGMSGTVRSAPNVCASPVQIVDVTPPVAGATITLRCRDQVVLTATTNEKGFFSNATAGMAGEGCVVRIEKEGFVPREMKLLDLCLNEDGASRPRKPGPCRARIVTELEPVAK